MYFEILKFIIFLRTHYLLYSAARRLQEKLGSAFESKQIQLRPGDIQLCDVNKTVKASTLVLFNT